MARKKPISEMTLEELLEHLPALEAERDAYATELEKYRATLAELQQCDDMGVEEQAKKLSTTRDLISICETRITRWGKLIEEGTSLLGYMVLGGKEQLASKCSRLATQMAEQFADFALAPILDGLHESRRPGVRKDLVGHLMGHRVLFRLKSVEVLTSPLNSPRSTAPFLARLRAALPVIEAAAEKGEWWNNKEFVSLEL